ncbi:MAG: DUF5331 domain-containing protein [Leptolyngbyaceae cyanobacterium RM2_2_4]|nr:DUF5331 domain-containing protein [Leptolyngbyaceae cyanobacterium RM2_2_4]
MNVEQLRQSVRAKWLGYYRENRSWLIRLGVWVNCEGQRRPSSSFILATLSILEPRLTQLLPLVVDLSTNPDRIVAALGLNFNPDSELEALNEAEDDPLGEPLRMLPGGAGAAVNPAIAPSPSRLPATLDEDCRGIRRPAATEPARESP